MDEEEYFDFDPFEFMESEDHDDYDSDDDEQYDDEEEDDEQYDDEEEEVELPLGKQLVIAAKLGTVERVAVLLDLGVDADSSHDGKVTGLMVASRGGHTAVVNLMFEKGANANAMGNYDRTALMWASRAGNLDIVEILHAHGANVNQQSCGGRNALHYAAFNDHLPVCEFLLGKGANLLAKTDGRQTAISRYGFALAEDDALSPATMALRIAALEAAWDAGPVQVQQRRDERWFRRGPLITVLAEHAYRPLQYRALAIALAAAEQIPDQQPVVALTTTKQQRHAFLLGRVFSNEGIVRLLVALL